MDILATFGTDEALEKDGKWFPLSKTAKVLVARSGNEHYVTTLRKKMQEAQIDLSTGEEAEKLAEEILLKQPPALTALNTLTEQAALGERRLLSHDQFKQLSRNARAVVRTGECQPYCNIALVSGVTF